MLIELVLKKQNNWKSEHFLILVLFTIVYALWCTLVVDFRIDHFFFYLLVSSFILLHDLTRRFAISMVFFIIFWMIYDSLRVFPNYTVSPVNFAEPYEIEKSIFGLNYGDTRITLNEYFKQNPSRFLDIITALFYLTWVPIPLALAIYFFFTDRKKLLLFSSCYLFTNFIGFIGYYFYPAAPPWYYEMYGSQFKLDIGPSAAGLLRFDNLINYPLFENLYKKNSNVFAAIPSLHAAYPVVSWYFARKNAPKWFVTLIFVDIIGIWFSAVYSSHHYLIDVLLGGLVAVISIFLYKKLILKLKFSNFISNFVKFIDN